MKREFLQNFSVNGQPLPKEVIDAILDEHSRICAARFDPFPVRTVREAGPYKAVPP